VDRIEHAGNGAKTGLLIMANIPAHMRLQNDVVALHRAKRSSNATLVALGLSIGMALAVVVLMSGIVG
jgi:hypothetical protein